MKKTKIALLLSLTLLLSSPLSAFAATHSVSSGEEIHDVFATDTDDEVILNLTDSVDMYYFDELQANEGQTYTFNTNNNEFANLDFGGEGNVVINGDVSGIDSDAIDTSDSVSVTVNGDIDAADGSDAVNANGDSSITVNGDLTAYGDGVDADDNSTVIINGSITALGDDGVETNDDASVTVCGDISANEDGINANDDEGSGASQVTVYGNVSGGVDGEADGVDAGYNASVTVYGTVSGTDYSVEADDDAKVTVYGSVSGEMSVMDNARVSIIRNTEAYLLLDTTDLSNKAWTNADLSGYQATLLVFIDPADAGAAKLVEEAQALQKAHSGLLVLGVLMGSDEAAAKALNADFPILRSTFDLLSFYGLTTPGMQIVSSDGKSLARSTDPAHIALTLAHIFA